MEGPWRRSTRWFFSSSTRRFKRRGKKWTQMDRRKVIATRSRPETSWLSLIYCSKNLRWNSRAEAASLRKAILCLFFLSWETLCALSHTYRDAQAHTHTHTHVLVLNFRRFVFLFVYLSMFFRTMLNARREVSTETLFIYKSYRITLFSNVSVW